MKKRTLLLTLLMALAMMALSPLSMWAIGGKGTSASPYTIEDAYDLWLFLNKVNSGETNTNAKLTADIVIDGSFEMKPIGTSSRPYTGTFDGQGHTISGFSMEGYTKVNAGFFGYVKDATIKNFTLNGTMTSSTQITSGENDCSGAVVGRAMGSSTIQDIVSNVNITLTKAQKHLGGVVGAIEGSTVVKGCTYTGTLDAGPSTDCIGGIVGFAPASCSGSIFYCFFNGTLSSSSSTPTMGGILGYTNDESNNFSGVQNCYSCGTLTYTGSNTYVNAIVGRIRHRATTTINNTYLSGIATRACNTDGPSIPASNKAITITLNAGTGGKVTQTYVNPTTSAATQLQVVATPNEHYHFGSWSDSGAQTHNVGLTANVSLTASFAIDQHQITVATNSSTMGTVSGGGTYDWNSKQTITATPKEHYHFVQWNDGVKTASRQITVTGNATYTATFAIDQHTITVQVASGQGSMGTVSGGGTFDYNSTKTITATPKEHYHFVQWNDGDTNASRTITVTENKTYTATFAPNPYTITVNVASGQSAMGTVSGGDTYDYGTQQTIKATANEHYHFVQWNDGNTDATRTITVTGDKTYTATFAINQYTIKFSPTDRGTMDGAGRYDYNSTVEISATPFPHLHFVKWDDGNTDNPRTITVTGDETYAAVFELHTYGDWITDKEPTCSTMGSEHCECTFDGCDAKASRPINMVAHTCSDFDANGFGECSVCHAEQYERPELDGKSWQIRNAGQLYYYANFVNNVSDVRTSEAELRNDIVVNDGTFDADGNFTPTGSSTTSTPRSWTPIGDVDNNREVHIEGYGNTISGLYFNDENRSAVGFVGRGAGSIKNLGVVNCYFKGYGSVGGICGWNRSYDIEISKCYVTGRICGVNTTGGLMGLASYGTSISRCWSDCIVTGTGNYVGGFCGGCVGVVEDCYSKGTVNGSANYVGGFCGRISSTSTRFGTIRNCYTTTTVSGESIVGSICGETMGNGIITNCYSTNTLPAIAQNDGTALYCESNVSAERLASGEIAYKLNGSVDGEGNWTAGPTDGTQTWYQLLGTDPAPGYEDIGNNKVFYGYDDCRLTSPRYTNLRTSDSPDKAHKYTLEHLIPAQDEDGLYKYTCIYGCGTIVPDKYILLYDQNLTETEMIELSVDAEGKYYCDFNIHISDGHSFHSPVEFYCRGHIFMRPNVPYIDNETPTPATTMLPFSIDIDKINVDRNVRESLKFYSFANLEQNLETGKWVANMYRVYDRLEAYTPYMILIYPETYYNYQGDQYSPAIFPVTPDPETLKVTEESGDWSFVGTNQRKEWTAADFGNGQAYYGFAAGNAETPTGKFVKVGQGAWIPPLRAYIKKNVQAGGASNAPTRAGAESNVPTTITVRLNEGETTGIAELNTETGEMSEVQWYDLNGRKIDVPTKGGIYIKNNKKVLVK